MLMSVFKGAFVDDYGGTFYSETMFIILTIRT